MPLRSFPSKTKCALFLAILLGFLSVLSGQEILKAVRDGDLEKVKALVEADETRLTVTDTSGLSLLHIAAFRGHVPVILYLLDRGLPVDGDEAAPLSPLSGAVYFGHREAAAALLDHGADIDNMDARGGFPLRYAIDRGHKDTVEFVLDRGASLDIRDRIGNSPLVIAVLSGHVSICRMLIEQGADVNAGNDRGGSPLSIALREGFEEVADLLEKSGADKAGRSYPVLKGPYLGQMSPGDTPEPFALGFVSTERNQLNAAFTPGRDEFYFCVRGANRPSKIMFTGLKDGIWTEPRPVSFTTAFSEIDLFISPDGTRMFFCSNRPKTAGGEAGQDHDFWMSERQGKSWGDPVHLGDLVNSASDDFYPTITRREILYFSSQREGPGTNTIFRSVPRDGTYGAAVKLGPEINTNYREFDPFIAPDESYLIFASERPGGEGASDLYISFRSDDGGWSAAVNMGPGVNSPNSDYTPYVSPDGRYLFFTSGRAGVDDIYWMETSVIERLRGSSSR